MGGLPTKRRARKSRLTKCVSRRRRGIGAVNLQRRERYVASEWEIPIVEVLAEGSLGIGNDRR